MSSTSPTRIRPITDGRLVTPAGRGPSPTVPVSDGAARVLAALGVLAIGLIHILDAAGTYESTRWIFWAYMALVVSALPVTLALLHARSRLVWVAAAGVAAGPFAAYVWSRSVGLPGDAGDIGNWLCTLGMAALFVEAAVIGLSVTRLRLDRRGRESGVVRRWEWARGRGSGPAGAA